MAASAVAEQRSTPRVATTAGQAPPTQAPLRRTPHSTASTECDRFRGYARGLVAQAPPLSVEQRTRLTALLRINPTAPARVGGVV